MSMLLKLQIVHIRTTHHRAENRQFSTLKRTKTDDTQPKLNAVCFVVQSCLTDADFVISSNYCLIGTPGKGVFLRMSRKISERTPHPSASPPPSPKLMQGKALILANFSVFSQRNTKKAL